MYVINANNVNDAYALGIGHLLAHGQRQDSRAGEVLVMGAPVMTITKRPWERVLLDAERRANPFFHLFECLWMLSGSDDATWLDRFVHDFSVRFAQESGTMWGAYGHRWRKAFGFDQLNHAAEMLRENHLDRRVVITMWSAVTDMDPGRFHDEPVRDLPCNTHIYPRVNSGALDLTVCCRSNDAYWGAHGANAVHFSFLQEYLAARIGVQVGKMYQLSNNYHGYTTVIPDRMPTDASPYDVVTAYPIVDKPDLWDRDLETFIGDPLTRVDRFANSFFSDVARPMWALHQAYRCRDRELYNALLSDVVASDWRAAAQMWWGSS